MPKLSIVIPVYNEEELVAPVTEEIIKVIGSDPDYVEIIIINDGSTDKTEFVLQKLKSKYPILRVINFEKNAGQSAAMACGFLEARGEYVVTLDGDGQNDPSDIPKIIQLLDQFHVVCGIRSQRRDKFTKRISSKIAKWFRQKVLWDNIEDIGCSLKGFHRAPLQKLFFFDGAHRFLPILLEMEGYSVGQIKVNHRPRNAGVSKYTNLGRLAKTWMDLLGVYWMRKRKLNYRIRKSL